MTRPACSSESGNSGLRDGSSNTGDTAHTNAHTHAPPLRSRARKAQASQSAALPGADKRGARNEVRCRSLRAGMVVGQARAIRHAKTARRIAQRAVGGTVRNPRRLNRSSSRTAVAAWGARRCATTKSPSEQQTETEMNRTDRVGGQQPRPGVRTDVRKRGERRPKPESPRARAGGRQGAARFAPKWSCRTGAASAAGQTGRSAGLIDEREKIRRQRPGRTEARSPALTQAGSRRVRDVTPQPGWAGQVPGGFSPRCAPARARGLKA